jgi:multidrug efflux pump subunit AcrA (membrane-fusion protein)
MTRVYGIAAVMMLAAVVLAACEQEVAKVEPIRPIRAVQIGGAISQRDAGLPGRAKATQEVNLSFRVSGPLITLPINIGDVVEQGALLARIDSRDFEVSLRSIDGQLDQARSQLEAMRIARPEDIQRAKAGVNEAEASLKLAQQNLSRVQNIQMQDPGAVSQSMVDQAFAEKTAANAKLSSAREELRIAEVGARPEDIAAKEAEIDSLEASVQSARDELSYTYLRAPFDGTIVAKYVENFEDVQAKQAIMRLLDTSRIEMVVDVPETKISNLPYVRNIRVRFDAFPGIEIPAEIKEVGREASQTTRTYPITLIMDQPEGATILPGMAGRATAEVAKPEASGLVVPVAAVFSVAGEDGSFVWVIDEASQTVSRRAVVTDQITPHGIAVTSGIESGEWVATAGVNSLREGQQVRIMDEPQEG